jgi:hypothetical protein
MPHVVADIRSLARSHTAMAINTLAGIARSGTNESARVAAAVHLLDRGWGKAPQAHTGENGEGAIQVIVRHIVGGKDEPRTVTIEERPNNVVSIGTVPKDTGDE